MGQTWGHNGPTDRAFFGHLGAETLTHAIPYTNWGTDGSTMAEPQSDDDPL